MQLRPLQRNSITDLQLPSHTREYSHQEGCLGTGVFHIMKLVEIKNCPDKHCPYIVISLTDSDISVMKVNFPKVQSICVHQSWLYPEIFVNEFCCYASTHSTVEEQIRDKLDLEVM